MHANMIREEWRNEVKQLAVIRQSAPILCVPGPCCSSSRLAPDLWNSYAHAATMSRSTSHHHPIGHTLHLKSEWHLLVVSVVNVHREDLCRRTFDTVWAKNLERTVNCCTEFAGLVDNSHILRGMPSKSTIASDNSRASRCSWVASGRLSS